MTSDEFFNGLSENAHNLMKSYSYIPSKKPFSIHIIHNKNNPSYMKESGVCYNIYIDCDYLKDNAEMSFLHEFLHCKQRDNNFSMLVPTSNIDKNSNDICTNLNSFVLDLNINCVLEKYGYKSNTINEFKEFSYIINAMLNSNTQENSSYKTYEAAIYYAVKIAMFKIEHNDVSQLLKDANNINEYISNIYTHLLKIYNMFNYNTSKGVYKIFKYLLSNLDLDTLEITKINNY